MFRHLSSIQCHLGVGQQHCMGTFSYLLRNPSKRNFYLFLSFPHVDPTETEAVDTVDRWKETRKTLQIYGEKGNKWGGGWDEGGRGASGGRRCGSRRLTQGKDVNMKASWGESDSSRKQKPLEWHPKGRDAMLGYRRLPLCETRLVNKSSQSIVATLRGAVIKCCRVCKQRRFKGLEGGLKDVMHVVSLCPSISIWLAISIMLSWCNKNLVMPG